MQFTKPFAAIAVASLYLVSMALGEGLAVGQAE